MCRVAPVWPPSAYRGEPLGEGGRLRVEEGIGESMYGLEAGGNLDVGVQTLDVGNVGGSIGSLAPNDHQEVACNVQCIKYFIPQPRKL